MYTPIRRALRSVTGAQVEPDRLTGGHDMTTRKPSPVPCPTCGTYCYGDCTAH